jgi:hypothetical protein
MRRLGRLLDKFTFWAWQKVEEDPIFLVVIALMFIFASAIPFFLAALLIALFGYRLLVVAIPVVLLWVVMDDLWDSIKRGKE